MNNFIEYNAKPWAGWWDLILVFGLKYIEMEKGLNNKINQNNKFHVGKSVRAPQRFMLGGSLSEDLNRSLSSVERFGEWL